uniref:CCHC-type domain-containing protein n=1 Tax=Clastoptera arizonana TaxID=38151 RepID=A0A1B6D012_9HEMI
MEVAEEEKRNVLFMIDTIPKNENVDIPKFSSKFEVLTSLQDRIDVLTKKPRYKPINCCFNCGSDGHSLRDCSEPRDHREIARNKKLFQDSKSNNKNGYVFQRYHLEEEQKYAHYKPGKISKSLRSALGITSYQLPPYIYNMRLLGYPLGWLEEIRVSHSGITMFDGSGNEVTYPEDEEGEVVRPEERDKYDVKKIISYPGFNVPPSSKVTDEYEKFKVPPFDIRQSKECLIEGLKASERNCNHHKFMLQSEIVNIDESIKINTDMEVEDIPEIGLLPEDGCGFIPPLPEHEILPPPPPDDKPVDNNGDVEGSSMNLSLQDLESKKHELLAELNDTSCATTPPSTNLGKIKAVDLGTPVLKSVSPYSCLPSANSFSSNICDVINFENLPDSTGKYEKMSGVIRKVRTKVSKMQLFKS